MAKRIRPIGHEDRLSLVEHLDELRTRIVIALAAFGVALAVCFWQNHALLKIVNHPLGHRKPVTLGVAEPFITTLTVASYAAILVAMPIILYELYGFVLPAFSPTERRVAMPLLLMVPFLFIAGVAFAYFVVIPAALQFLLHFNQHQFNLQVRARDYYGFVSAALIAVTLVFEVPLFILGLIRLRVLSAEKLRRSRRVGYVIMFALAVALPGVDPVTTTIEGVALLILFEATIWIALALDRRWRAEATRPATIPEP